MPGGVWIDRRLRWKRVDEAVLALRALWHGGDASFEGKFYSTAGIVAEPRPGPQPDRGGGQPRLARVPNRGRSSDVYRPQSRARLPPDRRVDAGQHLVDLMLPTPVAAGAGT